MHCGSLHGVWSYLQDSQPLAHMDETSSIHSATCASFILRTVPNVVLTDLAFGLAVNRAVASQPRCWRQQTDPLWVFSNSSIVCPFVVVMVSSYTHTRGVCQGFLKTRSCPKPPTQPQKRPKNPYKAVSDPSQAKICPPIHSATGEATPLPHIL